MRVVFVVIPLVIVAAIGGFVAWKIAGLKQRLVAELETALHATAQIDSLNLDLGKGELLAAGITLQNQRPEAPWDSASIDQAAIHFQFAKLFAPTMPLQVTVSGWKVTLHTDHAGIKRARQRKLNGILRLRSCRSRAILDSGQRRRCQRRRSDRPPERYARVSRSTA
jgi:hypothetical protein